MPRQLSPDGKKIRDAILKNPDKGNKELADELGVKDTQVAAGKQALRQLGQLKSGKKGRRKGGRPATVDTTTAPAVAAPVKRDDFPFGANGKQKADPFAVLDQVFELIEEVGAERLKAIVDRIVSARR